VKQTSCNSACTYTDNACNNGQACASATIPGCVASGGNSTNYGCSYICFHNDTKITYDNKIVTLDMLKSGKVAGCVVPHVLVADGVKLTTDCAKSLPLRLTNNHLVWTPEGYLPAREFKVGDHLYKDESSKCKIINVEHERAQMYFGLNCEVSEVLANGWKTSTFGAYHTLPSLWFKYASKVVGIERASSLGDSIVNLVGNYFDLEG